MAVFPNPVNNGRVTIIGTAPDAHSITATLVSDQGRVISSFQVLPVSGRLHSTLTLPKDISLGIYYLHILDKVFKVVIAR